ncbi:extracellular solute-binding protein [Paenibacillus sp. GCM10023252]|uniref:extracellular solute-binding protein n=1 Tax=Paenibacillus sp. GCM10023252 TaxID=3252649 RepID=UPI0036083FB8
MTGRKAVTLGIVIALIVTMIAACSSNNNSKENTAANNENTANNDTVKTNPNAKYNPPIEMTTVKNVAADLKFKEGESIENNVLNRAIEEDLGIKMKYLWTTSDVNAFNEKLRLMLASNQKMPDIVATDDDLVLADLMASGKFMDVEELFNKYAGDYWKSVMDNHPEAWYKTTLNGKIMAIPKLNWLNQGDTVLWIREDWMKKLNLTAPKTLDDLEAIMDAFVNQDPDGDNKKDTYGLAISLKGALNTWMANGDWIGGAYGVIQGSWNKGEEGKLVNGDIRPEMKPALERLASWMKKGYLSPDAATVDEMKATELFTQEKAGIVAGAYWMPGFPLPDLMKVNPKAEYKAYQVPVGPDGKAGYHTNASVGAGGMLISKDYDHPEAAIKYLNWFFDNYANPEPGTKYEHGLAKGYDWDEKDGKIVQSDPWFDVVRYSVSTDGARVPEQFRDSMVKISSGAEPTTPFEIARKNGETPATLHAFDVIMDGEKKGYAIQGEFTGAPTKTMQSKKSILDKMRLDVYTKIIYGREPIDAFDKFVEDWYKNGGEQMTKEVNEWYDNVTKK